MENIFELPSKDGNIKPEKARKSRQVQFHDKTAYVWGLRYRWDPSLSMNPVRRFAHFMPPCCWLISFSYFLNSSFVCCCLLLILFTLVSSSPLCFFIFLFVCYSLLPRKIWMSLSGHVPAWARSDHRRRLYDQDRRDRWREDQTADLGHCRPGAVRAWYSDQCMFDNCVL